MVEAGWVMWTLLIMVLGQGPTLASCGSAGQGQILPQLTCVIWKGVAVRRSHATSTEQRGGRIHWAYGRVCPERQTRVELLPPRGALQQASRLPGSG